MAGLVFITIMDWSSAEGLNKKKKSDYVWKCVIEIKQQPTVVDHRVLTGKPGELCYFQYIMLG